MSEPPVAQDAEGTPPPTTERRGRLLPGLVLAALLLLVAAAGVRAVAQRLHGNPDAAGLTVADRPAVDSDVRHRQVSFHGTLLGDGHGWSSTSARGQVLVVNFWASWCGPCRAEQPGLTAVARAFRDRGVEFIGVNIQDNRPAARAYAEEFAVPYRSLFDPGALTELPAVALPTTFILDRDGVIAYQLTGKTTVPVLTARLQALLAQGGRWQR
jgi:thiol-disulfide isomerase/thioredoxin